MLYSGQERPLLSTLDPTYILLSTLAFVVAVAVHEAHHAFVATALGDETPRQHGRVTLNPIRHIDAFGILFFALAGVGWGSTPVTPNNLRPNPRIGYALVAAAGPLSNLAAAFLLAIPLRVGLQMHPLLHQFLGIAVALNLVLFVFNLLPIPPLDGFSVLLGVLPRQLAAAIKPLEKYGMGILLVLLILPYLLGINLLGFVFRLALGPLAQLLGLAGLR